MRVIAVLVLVFSIPHEEWREYNKESKNIPVSCPVNVTNAENICLTLSTPLFEGLWPVRSKYRIQYELCSDNEISLRGKIDFIIDKSMHVLFATF